MPFHDDDDERSTTIILHPMMNHRPLLNRWKKSAESLVTKSNECKAAYGQVEVAFILMARAAV
jgi:hypothetical protein